MYQEWDSAHFSGDFSLLESLCKTKDSLKSLKGQLKENLKEKNSLVKTVRDLKSMNDEVKYVTIIRDVQLLFDEEVG